MPSMALTVPYMRTSPIHIPRRDLVLASADSLYLRVTIVDSDDPCAQALEITGGVGGPSAQFVVWPDASGFHDDYGMLLPVCGQVLWSTIGVPATALGAFDFTFPSGTMAHWPRRCGWAVQLNYDSAGAEVLLSGRLHVRAGGVPFTLATSSLLTDTSVPIHTDIEEPVFT